VLQAPVAGLARTLHALPTQLAFVLKKIEEKKASEQ
jgi:ribosomal protein L10